MLCLHFDKKCFYLICFQDVTVTCCLVDMGPMTVFLHHRNRSIFTLITHKNPIQVHSNMETLKPISCSRSTLICSNILIVLENECLFALRCSRPHTLNLHSSCQIRWQFVILLFDPFPPPTVPTYLVSWKKNTNKKGCICRSYTGNSAITQVMNGPGRCSFMMTARVFTALLLSFCKASTLTEIK